MKQYDIVAIGSLFFPYLEVINLLFYEKDAK